MRYFPILTDDEIRSICGYYPYKDLINGFKKCSKDFSALLPGRRPQSVSEETGRNLIANNPHSNLTARMIEVLLSSWVPSVTESVKEQIAEGKDVDFAYINALSKFGDPSFVRIFLRFVDEAFSEERIAAICAGVAALSAEREQIKEQSDASATARQIADLKQQQKKELKVKDQEIKKYTSEIRDLKKDLSEEREKAKSLAEENKQIDCLQEQLFEAEAEIERLKQRLQDSDARLAAATESYRESKERENELNAAILTVKSDLEDCQGRLSQLEQAREAALELAYSDTSEELRPVDMDEFIEYLSYNLSSMGLDQSKAYFSLLLNFLGNTIFSNKPIICNQAIAHSLSRCISNSLYGTPNVKIIPFTKELTSGKIASILETDARILVFDSFIGNYSEMELFPLFRKAKRKIIFVTAEYDNTIAYLLPEEVLLGCTYINANNIPELLMEKGLDEDPSSIKEELALPIYEAPDKRAQRFCKEIMLELGFSTTVASSLSEQMSSEETLDGFLAFSVIPYSVEAYGVSPYNVSDRLNKYAGFSGKSVYKELLMEWYGDV